MTRIKSLIIVLLISILAGACAANGRYQMTVITEGDHQLTGTTYGDLFLLGGQTTLPENALLVGSAHQLGGNFQLAGEIQGDLFHFNGELILDPGAFISGDLNLGGSRISGLEESAVGGEVNSGSGVPIPEDPRPQSQTSAGVILRWLISSLLLGLAGASLERYLPRQAESVGEAALEHFPVALSVGTLAWIAGISLLVLMAYTILLIPVALLGGVILGLAVVYGWIAAGMVSGRWLAARLQIQASSRRLSFGGAFIFSLLLQSLSAIPRLGGLLSVLAAAAGLGAVYLTRFGIKKFAPDQPGPQLQRGPS